MVIKTDAPRTPENDVSHHRACEYPWLGVKFQLNQHGGQVESNSLAGTHWFFPSIKYGEHSRTVVDITICQVFSIESETFNVISTNCQITMLCTNFQFGVSLYYKISEKEKNYNCQMNYI